MVASYVTTACSQLQLQLEWFSQTLSLERPNYGHWKRVTLQYV